MIIPSSHYSQLDPQKQKSAHMRKKCADNFKEELSASSARGPLLPVSRLFFTFNNSFCHKFSFAWYPSVCTSVCMLTHRGRCVFVDKWKLMKQRVAFFAMERNLADYSNNTWLWSSEMSLAVVQRYEAVRKDVEKKKMLFFFVMKISPKHPMCLLVSFRRM